MENINMMKEGQEKVFLMKFQHKLLIQFLAKNFLHFFFYLEKKSLKS